jgi:hypothetical protein
LEGVERWCGKATAWIAKSESVPIAMGPVRIREH